MSASTGCGGGACGCGGSQAILAPAARVNGIALHPAGRQPDEPELRERAWAELLRQDAVRQGLLPPHSGGEAPVLLPAERQVIETMLDGAVRVPRPTEEECRRYYEARQDQYVQGRMVHVRHILFAVTAGVNVHALARRAEQALLELSSQDVEPGRFAQLARELSNCPSGAQGGDLGWLGPHDCAGELARELFPQQSPSPDIGLHPRLMHSRHGFHVLEVLERRPGRQPPYEEVRERIGVQLAQQARARALHQYMLLLAGGAILEGVTLEGSDSPLVQ